MRAAAARASAMLMRPDLIAAVSDLMAATEDA
jgi:hypothetical protein